jgi:hypothetical protein
MKRKSIVVCFGYYSLAGWDVEVLQIAKTYVRQWCWVSHSNEPRGHPRHRTLRQIRADCLATARERAMAYEVSFRGVRQVVYAKSAKPLAKAFDIPEYRASQLLDRAQAALGGIRPAVYWLRTPAIELGGEIPVRLARYCRGWFRVCDELTRKQHAPQDFE